MDKRIYDIQGWMAEEELEFLHNLVANAGPDDLIVELGSWKGRSTAVLYSAMHHNQTIITIDTWLGQPDLRFQAHSDVLKNDIFLEFLENMRSFGIEPKWWNGNSSGACYLRMQSSDAALLFREHKINRLFIDCDHNEVGNDIDSFLPCMANGNSTMCGHDFNWVGVREVLAARFPISEIIADIWVADLNHRGDEQ